MQHVSTFSPGPRLVSTAWNLHQTRQGSWSLTETRFYDDGERVYQMPQPTHVERSLGHALARVPKTAREIDRSNGIPVAWAASAA